MNCFICKEKYNEGSRMPKLLPCGHTYCINCITLLYTDSILTCPQDENKFSIPSESLETDISTLKSLQNPIDSPFFCNNYHEMTTMLTGTSSKCNVCNKNTKEYISCPLCIYIICCKCVIWMQSTKIINLPGLVCTYGHPLRSTKNIHEFYKETRKKRPEKFFCDGCRVRKKGGSGHCRICRCDYCAECINRFSNIVKNITMIACGKKQNQKINLASWITGNVERCKNGLVWKFDTTEFKCSECKSRFTKSGAFACMSCSVFYCISCTYLKVKKNN